MILPTTHSRTIRRSFRCAQAALGVLAVSALTNFYASSEALAFTQAPTKLSQRHMMAPLRRLAFLPTEHNIEGARQYLTGQAPLKGLLAQPLSGEDFAQRFNTQLKAVADASGRFWTLDAIGLDLSSTSDQANSSGASSFQRAQLVQQYDLDGWINTELYFSADHTAVRMALLGPDGIKVIAREDSLLPYGADAEAVVNAFAQSLGRMSDTVGHDGQVVFENSDLVGIDFGVERGLTVGQTLTAGLVLQAAAHPQTGEVLRYQRTPLMTLEVIEAKQGASLCKRLTVDPDLMKQAMESFGSGVDRKFPMLVWRDALSAPKTHWQSAEKSARVDAQTNGFGSSSVAGSVQSGSVPSQGVGASQTQPLNGPKVAIAAPTNPFTLPSISSGPAGSLGSSIKIGVGVAKGELDLTKGPVSSSLPSFVLNQLFVRDGFRYSPEWDVAYGAEFISFRGDAAGSRLTGRASVMGTGAAISLPEMPMRWGVEGQLSTGTVKTEKSKKTLDSFELFGIAQTNRSFDEGWSVEGEAKISITGLIASAFGYEFGLDVHPGMAPKNLGVQWRILDDGDRWSEWSLGMTWKLGVVE